MQLAPKPKPRSRFARFAAAGFAKVGSVARAAKAGVKAAGKAVKDKALATSIGLGMGLSAEDMAELSSIADKLEAEDGDGSGSEAKLLPPETITLHAEADCGFELEHRADSHSPSAGPSRSMIASANATSPR